MDLKRSDVEQELHRILESATFENAERSKSILAYVVREELDGQGARIKAYAIGTQVLGRPETFDPNSDSIVRVEAGRLRRAIDIYYATEGAGDPLRITLERGSYRPVFTPGEAAGDNAPHRNHSIRIGSTAIWLASLVLVALVAAGTGQWLQNRHWQESEGFNLASHLQGPRILAEPFANMSGNAENDALATGLTIDTISELARFRWLTVYAALPQGYNAPDSVRVDGNRSQADYRLVGRVRRAGDDLTITARLEVFETGAILWNETYSALLNVEDLISIQQNIAKSIAVTVGQPGGIVGRIEQGLSLRDTDGKFETYRCVMLTYVYWRNFDPEQHRIARDCFEKTLDDDPDYAEGLAAYAFLVLDEYRYRYNPDPGHDPIQTALEHAEAALKADPYSSLAAQARMTLAAIQGDRETFETVGHEAIRSNPNNPDLIADYGAKLGLVFGDWASGIALVQRAWSLNPVPPAWSFISPATHAYTEGRCADSIALINRANSPLQPNLLLLRVACHNLLGNTDQRAQALADLQKSGVTSDPEIKDMIQRLALYPELSDRLTRDVCNALKASQSQT